jgi:hypothetical protein
MAAMAKKKHSNKKHRFKYAEPSTLAAQAPAVPSPAVNQAETQAPKPATSVAQAGTVTRDFSYVRGDLRRIAVLGGSLIALELILWYLFGHTSVGPSVYNLFSF